MKVLTVNAEVRMRKTVTKKRAIRKVNHVPGCGVPVGLRGGRGTGAGGF